MAHRDNAKALINEETEFEAFMRKRFTMNCTEKYEVLTEDGKLTPSSLLKYEETNGYDDEEPTMIAAPIAVLTLTDNDANSTVTAKMYIASVKCLFRFSRIEVYRDGEKVGEEECNASLTMRGVYSLLWQEAAYYTLNEITPDKFALTEAYLDCVRFKVNHEGIYRLEQFIQKATEEVYVIATRYKFNDSKYHNYKFCIFDNATKIEREIPTLEHIVSDKEDNNIIEFCSEAFRIYDSENANVFSE